MGASANARAANAGRVRSDSAQPRYDDVDVGTPIPRYVAPAVTRLALALFASAAADHNPIHVDDAEARAAGLPGAIVHGMLTMAFLGELVTRWIPLRSLRALEGRFVAMAYPGDVITCEGRIVRKLDEGTERCVELELVAHVRDGVKLLTGKATVALP